MSSKRLLEALRGQRELSSGQKMPDEEVNGQKRPEEPAPSARVPSSERTRAFGAGPYVPGVASERRGRLPLRRGNPRLRRGSFRTRGPASVPSQLLKSVTVGSGRVGPAGTLNIKKNPLVDRKKPGFRWPLWPLWATIWPLWVTLRSHWSLWAIFNASPISSIWPLCAHSNICDLLLTNRDLSVTHVS